MQRVLLPLSIFALAGAIFAAGGAFAGEADKGKAQCFPTSVLEVAGAEGAKYVGGATAFMRERVEAGRSNFIVFESSKGTKILCTW